MATQLPAAKFMEDMGQCDKCPAALPPLDQARPLYHSRTICFHCVMIGLHLGGFRPETPVVVSAHLLRRLRDGELRDNLTGLPVGPEPTGIVGRLRTRLRRLWDKAREL